MQCTLAFALLAGTASATLYGLTEDVGLVKIDPATGTSTPIGIPIPKEAQAQNVATLDAAKGRYYFIGFNETNEAISLIGISLKSGKEEVRVVLPFVATTFVGIGQALDIDPTNGEVFAVGLEADSQHHIYRVNPITGVIKLVGTCGFINVLGAAHAYDYNEDILWLQYGVNQSGQVSIDIFGFDAHTGTVKHKVPQSVTKILETMKYDPVTKSVIGLGYNTVAKTRTLIRHTPEGKLHTIGDIKGYFIENGGISALDTKTQIAYFQLQPSTTNSSTPFSLVGVDVTNSTVVSHAVLCDDPAMCPWSLEYSDN